MKIVSFNINSIRARPHQLQSIINLHNPDVIGLQETKVHDDEFPIEMITDLGYLPFYHGQKGHYGVALLSKKEPMESGKGFKDDTEESQRRLVWSTFEEKGNQVTIINGYFPQGEERKHPTKFPAKKKFYEDLILHLNINHSPKEKIIVMGDLNISPEDIDIGIGENNKKRWLSSGKCSFLPEEREWLSNLISWGFVDTYRSLNPTVNDRYSWFDYRSRGFDDKPKRGLRIDQIWATDSLSNLLTDTGIDYITRGMEKPSDHAPIWSNFEF